MLQLTIHSNHMEEIAGISSGYPYVLNQVDGTETIVPWHWHEEVELSYIVRGSLKVTISGQNFIFGEKEGFYINSNILHTMEPADPKEGVFWHSHLFHPTLLGSHYRSVFDTKYIAPVLKNKNCELLSFRKDTPNRQTILELLRQLALVQEEAYHEFKTRNLLSDIWLLLIKELQDPKNTAKPINPVNQERIQTMLTFIHGHFSEKLTLDHIAEAAAISKRECLRCFQACIQKSPIEYLTDYRLQAAENLLRTTGTPITDIALQTGFTDSAYFAKIFREKRGFSPTQYRKSTMELQEPL